MQNFLLKIGRNKKIILIFSIVLLNISYSFAQQIEEFILPANIDKVTFIAAGGKGGSARTRKLSGQYTQSSGGLGAIISAEFNVGSGANEIPDGSRIRYVLGGYGQPDMENTSVLGVAIAAGGGGAGTAVLYKAPTANNWTVLIVAGGGGGAYTSLFADLVAAASNGKHGEFGNSGSSGSESSAGSGGTNGNGGGSGGIRAGGGGGQNTDGGSSVSCSGFGYGEAGNKSNQFSGGLGGTNCYSNGGSGWGGGGSGYLAGGGGGGYSGGGGGGLEGGGGGGGSYIHPMRAAIISNSLYSGNEYGYANVSYVLDTPCTDQVITVDNTATFNAIKNVSCKGGNDGSATVKYTTTNAARTIFSWTPAISSANGAGRATVTGLSAGVYNCKISILSNTGTECTFKNVEVVIKEPLETLTARLREATNTSCNGATDGRLAIIADGGTQEFTYNWTPTISAENGAGMDGIKNLAAGSYICKVTDANGCKVNFTHTITQPTAIDFTLKSQTNVSCNGGNNGVISINTPTGGPLGQNPQYRWSRTATPNVIITPVNTPTGSTISNLNADSYTCLVTIGTCTFSKSFMVTQPNILVLNGTSSNEDCIGSTNGTINAVASGGTGNYTYDWNFNTYDGQSNLSNLAPNTYTCIVTDQLGCIASKSFMVGSPVAFSSIWTILKSQCETPTGFAQVTINGGNGGYSYVWENNSSTTNRIDNVGAGTYKLTISDSKGCTFSTSAIVENFLPLTLFTQPTVNNASCFNTATGSIIYSIPYTSGASIATWFNSQNQMIMFIPILAPDTDISLQNVNAGNYKLILIGNPLQNCDKTINITIAEPPAISPPISTNASSTLVNTSQTITLSATGCTGTVNWYNASNQLLPNNTPPVIGGENFYAKCVENGCESAKSADIQVFNNDLCVNPIPITTSMGEIIPNFPLQNMSIGTNTNQNGSIICGTINTNKAKDIWYSVSANANNTVSLTISPTAFSTGNLMGAELYNGCNGAFLACQSNNGANSNTPFTLSYTLPEILASFVAADYDLKLRVWELNFSDANAAPTGTFTITGNITALPITLISFSGKSTENRNELTWKTADEKAFSHFEIEKSIDTKKFEKLGELKGNSSEIYLFLDKTPSIESAGFYRLKMVDLDGNFTYSKIISLQSEPKNNVFAYPNPSTEMLYLTNVDENEIIKIYSSLGKLIKKVSYDKNTGVTTSELSAGVYFLKTKFNVIKIIKQ